MSRLQNFFQRLFTQANSSGMPDVVGLGRNNSAKAFQGRGTVLAIRLTHVDVITASVQVEELVQLLARENMHALSLIAGKGGLLVQHVGGSILACWPNGPANQVHHASEAAFAAARNILNSYSPLCGLRAAIATGDLVAGFFGPKSQYQIRGEAVSQLNALMEMNCDGLENRQRLFLLTPSLARQLALDILVPSSRRYTFPGAYVLDLHATEQF